MTRRPAEDPSPPAGAKAAEAPRVTASTMAEAVGVVEAVEAASTLRCKASEWRRAADMLTGLSVDQPPGNAEFVRRMAAHCITRAEGHERVALHLLRQVGADA